jgi:MFS family permease
MFQLLSQFRIIVDISIGIVAQTALTFLEPVAQIHVTNFFPEVTPSKMGLLFMLAILCYAAMAPLAGWLSDTRFGRHPVMSVGLFFISVGLYMFGPIGWPFTVPTMGVLISGLAVVCSIPQPIVIRVNHPCVLFWLLDHVAKCPHSRDFEFPNNNVFRCQVGLGMGAATVPIVPDIIESAGAGNEETASGLAGLFTYVEFYRDSVHSGCQF